MLSKYRQNYWKFKLKFLRTKNVLLMTFIVIICLLLYMTKSNKKFFNLSQFKSTIDSHLFINRIRHRNILDKITSSNLPRWLNSYNISYLFNFYWLHNGGYQWHVQRLIDLKENPSNLTKYFHQHFPKDFNQINLLDYLNSHPEHGILIDTAMDPIQSLFPPLPQTSISLERLTNSHPWLINRYFIPTNFKLLITYALYDVTLDNCQQCKYLSNSKIHHYDEFIYLFDSQQQIINETIFLKEILARLIRLLALVSESTKILIPYLNRYKYIQDYIDILIERDIIKTRDRFIEYNFNEIYHCNVLYSTSSPRSDLILLNRILIGNKPVLRRELILILRDKFSKQTYDQIIQIINQFEMPIEFEYIHLHEYTQSMNHSKYLGLLFQQSRIIIGQSTNLLASIVWCLPRTQIIEIINSNSTLDVYQISSQLQFNYWLIPMNQTNQIDTIDFRNIMLRVLMDIDA